MPIPTEISTAINSIATVDDVDAVRRQIGDVFDAARKAADDEFHAAMEAAHEAMASKIKTIEDDMSESLQALMAKAASLSVPDPEAGGPNPDGAPSQ